MKDPKEFPKALWAVTICEVAIFTVAGAVIYNFTGMHYVMTRISISSQLNAGNQYVTAPAFGSLQPTFKKIAFSFAIPAIIFLGSLYAVRFRFEFYFSYTKIAFSL